MEKLIDNFANQIKEGLAIGKDASFTMNKASINNVLISGLGGSGIGGQIVAKLVSGKAKCPIVTNNDYNLPYFVDENTLVIICSYSGNTEETLSTMNAALQKNAEIACITSGGKVLENAEKYKLNHIVIPSGFPPRSCLGYNLTQLLIILEKYGLIDSSYDSDLSNAITLIENEKPLIQVEASKIAAFLHNKYPILYSSSDYEGMIIRLRQQLNENSKILCSHHVFPEMNHNELVGWRNKDTNLAVLVFRDTEDHRQVKRRMDICKPIFEKYTDSVKEIFAKGSSLIEKTIYFIHLGDWVSFYLSEMREVDVTEVKVIDFLKSELLKK